MDKPSRVLIVSAAAALLAIALAIPAGAQTPSRKASPAAATRYDVSREVTIEGTVARVVSAPTPGMLVGAHVYLTTSAGTVDAHLGIYAMRGANALKIAPGERVRMTGVMVTVKDQPILLVRTAQTGAGTYAIRDAHGFPLRPASASATRPEKDAKGGRS
jgi:DNA/RNA endonuclease YhcR with UshA esterase domain